MELTTVLFALLIGAIAVATFFGPMQIAREMRSARERTVNTQALDLLSVFAPGVAAASADPKALLAWQPLAVTARNLAPEAFAALDQAAGATFPFSKAQLEAAHSQWSAEWLTWEAAHTGEYKMKAAAAEAELAASGGSPIAKARWESVEREKLDLYQRHYSEYVRIAKALQALIH